MDSHNSGKYSLWGGRFQCETDDLMKHFNQSINVDKRLWKEDIIASKAWANSIQAVGLLTVDELKATIKGLEIVSIE